MADALSVPGLPGRSSTPRSVVPPSILGGGRHGPQHQTHQDRETGGQHHRSDAERQVDAAGLDEIVGVRRHTRERHERPGGDQEAAEVAAEVEHSTWALLLARPPVTSSVSAPPWTAHSAATAR